jgi:type I restriction enzyme S subunit
MKIQWKEIPLCEITSKIGSGATPRGGKSAYRDSGISLIRSLNVYDFKFNEKGLAYISEAQASALNNVEVEENDILLNITGASVARCCIVSSRVLPARVNQHVVIIRVKPEVANAHFVLNAINSQQCKTHLLALAQGGATREALTKSTIESFKVPLPDLLTQQKIAGILSAYDDLIENNLRRIAILEEMAQSLYREWFVHFRFPGHEAVKFVDSELGKMPEGWEVKACPEAVAIRPKIPVPKHDKIPFIPMGSLSENSMLIGEGETRPKAAGARFQNGDTVFARITPCLENGKTGFVQFLPDDGTICCGSTEFIVLRSKTLCPEYVYLMARSDAFRDNAIKSMTGATGRQRVRDECFEQFFLAQPPVSLLERFQQIVQPMFKLIHSLDQRNQNLRKTRDLLLPKLLTQ